MPDNVTENQVPRTFMEESAQVFRVPVLLLLSLLTLATLAAFTYLTGELLDRVLVAFSKAAALKHASHIGANFRHLIAAGLWFCAFFAVVKQARHWFPSDRSQGESSRIERFAPLGLLVVLMVLWLVYPSAYGLLPLWMPLGLLMTMAVVHAACATRISAIALRELATLLLNPLGYVVFFVFAVVLAFLFFGTLDRLSEVDPSSELNIAPLKAFFGVAQAEGRGLSLLNFIFLAMALLLFVAVVTMRLIAEERRSGTEEVLLTTPVREWHVVIGKFGGTFLFYLLMWALALAPFFFLSRIGTLDGHQVLSSFLGLAVIGFGLLGVGMLASAITRNQLAAAVLSFLGMLPFIFQFVIFPSYQPLTAARTEHAWFQDAAHYLDLRQHLAWVARGTVDSRTVFLFLSLGVLTLFLSVRAVETRRWAGFSLAKRLTPSRALGAGLGAVALVLILVGLAYYTGQQQVSRLEAAHREQAKEQARLEAEALAGDVTRTEKPEGLFEDKAKIEGGEKKITPGQEAPSNEEKPSGAKPPEDQDVKKEAPKEKEKSASGNGPDQDAKKNGAETGSKDSDAAPPAGTDEAKAAAPAPEFKPSWTPRRILWMVGAGLILLMVFLAVFARWLSGGLSNQIVFGSNVIVGSLAALTLVVLINYLATRNHKSIDLTEGKIYSLAPEVGAAVDRVLEEGESVDVIALVGRYRNPDTRDKVDDNVRRDTLERIFQKFAEGLNRPGVRRFSYRFVDPDPESPSPADIESLKQVVSEYDASARDVIIRYRNRHEILADAALFEMVKDTARFQEFLERWRNRVRRGLFAPPMPPTEAAQFRIAEAWMKENGYPNHLRRPEARPALQKTLAETIVQLVESPGNNLYFTVGHGEKRLDIQRKAADLQKNFGEATILRETLARANFNLTPLAPITGDREIPARARYLLIAGPTRPFAQEELDKIETWVKGGGNLLVFDEASHDSGLSPLLRKFGVEVEKAQIWMARSPGPGRMRMGQLVPAHPWVIIDKYGDKHPIAKALGEMDDRSDSASGLQAVRPYPTLLMLLASPLKILHEDDLKDEEKEAAKEWKASPVLEAGILGRPGPQMLMPYAESDVDGFRPTKDGSERMGPFDVAVMVEPADDKLAGQRGKVLVVGDTDFIEDRIGFPDGWPPPRAEASTYGAFDNEQFIRTVLNYLKKRPSEIEAKIAPPILYLGDVKSQWVHPARVTLWVWIPAAFLVLGLFVFFVRRRA
jgi:ABC-2 type transport system permease protein